MHNPEKKSSDDLAQHRTDLADKRTDMATERSEMATDRTKMAAERTKLAAERNVMAADRSLMAWIRTGLSMIGFGFTIYKFLQYMRDEVTGAVVRVAGPRRLGLFLIALGTASLLFGGVHYFKTMKKFDKDYGFTPWRFTLIAAIVLGIVGAALFVSIVMNREFL